MTAKSRFTKRGAGGLWVLGFLAANACSSGTDVGIPASAQAQSHGVHAYNVVSGTQVALLARDGSTLGKLTVSEPDAASRLVEIAYADGQSFTNEISGPIDGSFRAPVLETREGFIQADPALAPFFGGHALEIAVLAETAPVGLEKASVALCNDIGFASACAKCPEESLYPCTYSRIEDGNVARAWASCEPRVEHGCGTTDIVSKVRTCYITGGCSQMALGFMTCGSEEPFTCGRRNDDN